MNLSRARSLDRADRGEGFLDPLEHLFEQLEVDASKDLLEAKQSNEI